MAELLYTVKCPGCWALVVCFNTRLYVNFNRSYPSQSWEGLCPECSGRGKKAAVTSIAKPSLPRQK